MPIFKKNKKRESSELSHKLQVLETLKEVEITFYSTDAKSVSVAGTFNDWNTVSLPLVKEKDGTWKTRLKLQRGKYEYKYFVDGNWVQEMPCNDFSLNPFGTWNCVLGVQ